MVYSYEEALEKSLEYFDGGEIEATTFLQKYAEKDKEGNYLELTPDDMHRRMAREFARIESHYPFPLKEETIYKLFRNFADVIPQGSVMSMLGCSSALGSLSNCFRGGVKVLTREGFKPIKDIVGTNQKVMTKGGGWVVAPIQSFGTQKLWKLVLTKGKSNTKTIYTTEGHRWFVLKGDYKHEEKTTNELSVGDRLKSQYGKGRSSFGISPFGIAHGITFGDGHSVKNTDCANNITPCGDSRVLGKYFIYDKVSSDESLCEGGSDFYSNIPNYFRELPDINENKSYLYGWLSGYFAADGHIDSGGTIFINSSKKGNLEFVQDVCGVLGIGSGEIKETTVISNLTNRPHTMYRVCIGRHLTKDFFLLDKHRERFQEYEKNPPEWKVVSVEETDTEEEVFCAVVPDTQSFVIEGNILTGNCIVLPKIYDSYGGIAFADQQLTQLYKRRCGCGLDISTLRPNKATVTNAAGSSTGAASFMHRFSNTTREVGQKGRRGALMITMDVRHPDIFEFVNMKQDLTKVTGANVSIKLTDEFMNCVEADKEFLLRFPIDSDVPEYSKTIRAKELWDKIIEAAHKTAEPGLIFWDRQHWYSTSSIYPGWENISTNPCCFSVKENVFVVTKNGIKEIKAVTRDDLVWVDDKEEWVKTSGYFTSGNHATYKVTFNNNEEFIVTNNHKFPKVYDSRGSESFKLTELKDLKPGDKIKLHINEVKDVQWSNVGSYEEGMILGWLNGDGCLSFKTVDDEFPTTHLSFWKDEHDLCERYLEIVNNLGIKSKITSYNLNRNCVKRISSSLLTKYFTEKFEINIWNFRKNNTNILFNFSKDFIRGFLSAYFTADGTVSNNKSGNSYSIQLASINLDVLKQVKYILNLFGIKSSVSVLREAGTNTFRGHEYKTKTCYRLSITGASNITKFVEEINFLSDKKRERVADLVNNLSKRYRKQTTYTRIKSIEYAGESEVGCISLEKHHYFTANGMLVGNSEIAMNNDSCRLIALNLYRSVVNPFTPDAYFDYKRFRHISYYAQRLMDDLVDLELEHIERIIEKVEKDPEPDYIKAIELKTWKDLYKTGKEGRRTGLGFTALADTLAALGIKFDSDEALETTEQIMRTKLEGELSSSIDMAIERGAFEAYDRYVDDASEFTQMIGKEFPFLYKRMSKVGRRNISWSTVAPNGTLSILARTSSGIEPVYMLSYTRRRKINDANNPNARVDFVDDLGDKWEEFEVFHPKLKTWMDVTGETDITKSPYYGCTASDIDWQKRVDLQAIVQKYTTHSISSTVNLPSTATKEDVGNIYFESWKKGLKGITVYRDGSRSGVLVSKDDKNKDSEVVRTTAPKRPKILYCEIHHTRVKGDVWKILVGFLDGEPYEVFAFASDKYEKVTSGFLKKSGGGKYDLLDSDKELLIEDVASHSTEEEAALSRMISTALRHGSELKFIVEQLNKANGFIGSFSRAVGRILSKYIEAQTGIKCLECGSESVIMEEGCQKCLQCGSSKCG